MKELSEQFENNRLESALRADNRNHVPITDETRKWSWGKSIRFMITVSVITWVGILTVLMA